MVNIVKKLQWCPQPQKNNGKAFSTAVLKLSPRVLAFVILTEILVLLIAPLTYYAFLAPKTFIYSEEREVALTNSQIKEAWPNLPRGDEIKNGAIPYIDYNGTLGTLIQNRTRINLYVNAGVAKIPIAYLIFVQDGKGSWVQVPQEYLITDNPPKIQPAGFMGTNVPANYVIIVIIVTVTTLAVGTSYILLHKKAPKNYVNS